ncbi:MAG TPA: hypothetical protein VIL30_25070 [Ramlibacter sp.]
MTAGNDHHVAAMQTLRAVHWHLRDGFCDCLRAVSRCEGAQSAELAGSLQILERLVGACEALYRAEHDTLAAIRHRPDSSWANRDLLWGAHALAAKALPLTRPAEPDAPSHLDSLQQYLALFFGELLVQLHAKEAMLAEWMRHEFGASQARALQEELTGVLAILRPKAKLS